MLYPETSLISGGKKETLIANIRDVKEDIITDPTDIERVIRNIMNNFMPINLTT